MSWAFSGVLGGLLVSIALQVVSSDGDPPNVTYPVPLTSSPSPNAPLPDRDVPRTADIEIWVGAANVSDGDEDYRKEVSADIGDTIAFYIYYYNRENPQSGRYAKALSVRVTHPTYGLGPETWTATVVAENSNREVDGALIRIPRKGYLKLIPGSVTWRHNQGTDDEPDWITTRLNDQIVGKGITIEDAQPCVHCEATVRLLLKLKRA